MKPKFFNILKKGPFRAFIWIGNLDLKRDPKYADIQINCVS